MNLCAIAMVFYYFGPDRSSWAFGNDRFALANRLPEPIQAVWDQLAEPFEDKQMAGTRIHWMSTSPGGNYAIMTKNGDCVLFPPSFPSPLLSSTPVPRPERAESPPQSPPRVTLDCPLSQFLTRPSALQLR